MQRNDKLRATTRRRRWSAAAMLTVGMLVVDAQASPLPDNDLHLEHNPAVSKGIAQDELQQVIRRIEFLYRPLFFKHGGPLVVDALWASSTVNAFA